MINARNMRILVMYDLPSVEGYEKREYHVFNKQLIKEGYFMIQFSIYVKQFNHQIDVKKEIKKLEKFLPKSGSIRAIPITEYQWEQMIIILGEKNFNEILNGKERYIKI